MESLKKKILTLAAAGGLILAGCGGSDSAATTTAPPVSATAAVTVATTTTAPANSPVTPITDGAKVVVINASRVDGAASRMSNQLKEVGYTVGTPTGSGSTLQRIETSKVFYIEADAQAKVVADNLRLVLGGGAIEVLPMPTPAPTESGELEAGTTVVVAVGNDTADKTLNELQGITTGSSGSTDSNGSTDSTGSTGSTDSTTPTSDSTGDSTAPTTPTSNS